jgi:hypothetical protein
MVFFSFWVTEKQSKSVEFLLNTNFILQQKRSKKEGEKIDRSQDIRYVQEFYRRFRERNRVDELEEEVRRDRERQSSDQDTSMLEKQVENLRRVYLMARILNEVVDALQITHSEMTIDLSVSQNSHKFFLVLASDPCHQSAIVRHSNHCNSAILHCLCHFG